MRIAKRVKASLDLAADTVMDFKANDKSLQGSRDRYSPTGVAHAWQPHPLSPPSREDPTSHTAPNRRPLDVVFAGMAASTRSRNEWRRWGLSGRGEA